MGILLRLGNPPFQTPHENKNLYLLCIFFICSLNINLSHKPSLKNDLCSFYSYLDLYLFLELIICLTWIMYFYWFCIKQPLIFCSRKRNLNKGCWRTNKRNLGCKTLKVWSKQIRLLCSNKWIRWKPQVARFHPVSSLLLKTIINSQEDGLKCDTNEYLFGKWFCANYAETVRLKLSTLWGVTGESELLQGNSLIFMFWDRLSSTHLLSADIIWPEKNSS